MEGHARDLAVERGLDLVVYTGTLLVHIVAGVVDFAPFVINMCFCCQSP